MINRLNQVLNKRGTTYIEKFLDEELVITEKLDTYRIIFEKKGDDIIFYKKDNTPINLIERVLTDVYEDAILEIPLITKQSNIPEGLSFGIYYTPTERPLRIPYSRLPKYILTDVSKRDENFKITESLNYDEVKDWAGKLCMGRPPIVFEGKLNEDQKKLLISYDTKEYDGENMTFSKMVEKSFKNSYSHEDIIEGLIIKSKDKISQVISYEFDILNEAYEKDNGSRDFYDIVISDLTEFLNNYNIPILEAENKDELYINLICNIFNNYCSKQMIIEGIDEKYLTPRQFGYCGKLNKKFIKNNKTLNLFKISPIYEALFKVILSSFRKPKKPYGLLTEGILNKFNGYVSLINGYVNGFENTINENELLDESRSDNIVIDAIKKRKPDDIDNMRVIASIQKAFEPQIKDIEKGKKHCAVYITTLEPFTNSQMNNVHMIKDTWNVPVIIFSISNKQKIKGNNFHASDELIKAQMQALLNFDNSIIPGFGILDSWNLTEIFEFCRPDFEPIVIITDTGKKSEMALQLFFEEEVMGGRINVEDKFNIGELNNEDRISAFRAIEDNNYSLLLELIPPAIHNVIDQIFSEYRLWSGQILKPINN
ncbi:hypothetical protein M0Q50_08765 [bacterium]|jgi:hypothetical protein|nr:hypothetical protein [bacterium]